MIRAVRYIDDVLAIVAWDASVPSSKAYAKAITSCLAVAYHENMDLKEEAITHEIPFLQGKVVLDNAKVHVKYNNKNLPSLLTTGKVAPDVRGGRASADVAECKTARR